MVAVRDAETAARSIGLNPVSVKAAAFMLSAVFAGFAGGIFATLLAFVAPDSFPFSQSILFLLACVVEARAGCLDPRSVRPSPSCCRSCCRSRGIPAAVLRHPAAGGSVAAPEGVLGTIARLFHRIDPRAARPDGFDIATFLAPPGAALPLRSAISASPSAGIKAASGVSFSASPGQVTSVIGPNGAGKTTVLNMIGGFYRPDAGSIRLGNASLPARRHGRWRAPESDALPDHKTVRDHERARQRADRDASWTARFDAVGRGGWGGYSQREGLLAFVGYRDALARAAAICRMSIGGWSRLRGRGDASARAAAGRAGGGTDVIGQGQPKPPAAQDCGRRRRGHSGRARYAAGDGNFDHVVVLDAGRPIAAGTPNEVRHDAKVLAAYLGAGETRARGRQQPWSGPQDVVLATMNLAAGYGAAPVLQKVNIEVKPARWWR